MSMTLIEAGASLAIFEPREAVPEEPFTENVPDEDFYTPMVLAYQATQDPEKRSEVAGELFRHSAPRMYSVALGLLGSEVDAEDAVQDAWMRALGALDRFQLDRGGFEAWMVRITKNLIFDEFRRRKRHEVRAAGINFEDERQGTARMAGTYILQTEGLRPDQVVEAKEGLNELLAAPMSKNSQSAVMLAHVYSFPYEKIASVQEVPIGTVRSRIHRGVQAMRQHLDVTGK